MLWFEFGFGWIFILFCVISIIILLNPPSLEQRQREYLHDFVLQMSFFISFLWLQSAKLARGSQRMEQI